MKPGERPVIPSPFDDDADESVLVMPSKQSRVRKPVVQEEEPDDAPAAPGGEPPLPVYVHGFVCTKQGCRVVKSADNYDAEKDVMVCDCGAPMQRHAWPKRTKGQRTLRTESAA